jgi:hypothetical protein
MNKIFMRKNSTLEHLVQWGDGFRHSAPGCISFGWNPLLLENKGV